MDDAIISQEIVGNLTLDVDSLDTEGSSSEEMNDVEENAGRESNATKNVEVGKGLKKITDLTVNDVLALDFGSEAEACDFYRTYARCHGFVMRKDDVARDAKGNIIMRQLVCNREGLRAKKHLMRSDRVREQKPITRTNCPAKFRIHLDFKTKRWTVVGFIKAHNHELIPNEYVQLNSTYRARRNADKCQENGGEGSYQILGFMPGQTGGDADLCFCKGSVYNHNENKGPAKIEDDDSFAALSYLQGKADNDPFLFAKFTTKDGRLEHLFWADGISRVDFECFGDVVAFDTSYGNNTFNKPLVIFSGINHHGQTIVFGCALVADETIESYKWVLRNFSRAMFDRHPKVVVTDGDDTMRKVIKLEFPNTKHRLCTSHLQKIVCENIKDDGLLQDFNAAVYSNFNQDEFEDFWKKMIDRYGLAENKWIEKMHKRKRIWATAFLRDSFFWNIKTTSQCEGINSFIERVMQRQSSLVDFLHNFDCAVREYRNNEFIADLKSNSADHVMTTSLYILEQAASRTFTTEIFREVKNEIEEAGALNVIERTEINNSVMFRMNKYGSPNSSYSVKYDVAERKFLCDCRLVESRGIPCSHIFGVMRHDHMDDIPSSLICKRWTKNAKTDVISSNLAEDGYSQRMIMVRYVALNAACSRVCHAAAKNADNFVDLRNEIFKLTEKLQQSGDLSSVFGTMVGDTTIIKTKEKKLGVKRRRCMNCHKIGHTTRTCRKRAGKETDSDNSSSDVDINKGESNNDVGDSQTKDTGSLQTSTQSDRDLLRHQASDRRGEESILAAGSVATPQIRSPPLKPLLPRYPMVPWYPGVQYYAHFPPVPMTPPNGNVALPPQYFGSAQNVPGGNQ